MSALIPGQQRYKWTRSTHTYQQSDDCFGNIVLVVLRRAIGKIGHNVTGNLAYEETETGFGANAELGACAEEGVNE